MSGQKTKALAALKTLFVDKKEKAPSEPPENPNNYLSNLPTTVRDGPLKVALNITSKGRSEFVAKYMSEIVRDNSLKMEQNAVQDVQEADAIMKDMTDQLFSFDNQPKSEAIKKTLREKRKENKFTKGLGANVLRKRGILSAPKRSITYANVLPLHALWEKYVSTALKGPASTANLKRWRLDYHGALIRVVRSNVASLVGVEGIVILETAATFKIVQKDDKLKVIPKNNCHFLVLCPPHNFTVFGKRLSGRPAEKTIKKMKGRSSVSL